MWWVKCNPLHPLSTAELFRQFADLGAFTSLATVVGREDFESFYLPIAERVAERLQEAPLSQTAFPDRGGALQCALRSGLLAVRMCDKTIFSPTATAAQRMVGDREYRWLSYCAALGTVYLQSIAQCEVVLETGEIYSHANDCSLQHLKTPYELRWRPRSTLALPKLHVFLSQLWFPGQFAHISYSVLIEFAQSINPSLASTAGEPPLARVVRQSIEKCIADDIAARAGVVGAAKAIQGEVQQPEPDAPAAVVESDPPASTATTNSVSGAAPVAPAIQSCSAPTPDPLASASPEPAKPRDEELSPAVQKAIDWIRAIGTMESYDPEIQPLSDGCVEFSRKALAFGDAPKNTYAMLHSAGLIERRAEKSATIKAKYGRIYMGLRAPRERGARP